MRRLIAFLAAAAMAGCVTARASGAGGAAGAMLQLEQRGFAGSVLVACGDAVLFAGDYGPERQGREPSYWVASITKQFTAVAILQLARAGRLSLEDPVARYFPDAPEDKAGVTIRHLLLHQSGLAQAYRADGLAERSEAAAAILAGDVLSPPGAEFHYSNDNYTLLAIIIELVSGQRYEAYMRTHVIDAAGMQRAGFWPEAGDDLVPPLMSETDEALSAANWGFRGGTGMRASVSDLHRWARALDAGVVLAPEDTALLYGPHIVTESGAGIGFGWYWSQIDGVSWYSTRGSDSAGYNAVLYRRADTPLIVIAATHDGPAEADGPGWSRQARDALIAEFSDGACAAPRG